MAFAHPFLLALGVLAALPVIMHLIGKSRAKRIQFAAFDFLMAAKKRFSFWEMLRRWLLLLARTLVIVCIVAAAARPSPVNHLDATDEAMVLGVVLDTSLSMNYRLNGRSLLSVAQKEIAARIGQHEGPVLFATVGHGVNVLTDAPTFETDAIFSNLKKIEQGAGSTALSAGVAGLLESLPKETSMTLVLASDFSRPAGTGLPIKDPRIASVEVLDAAKRRRWQGLDNQSLVDATFVSQGQQAGLVRVLVKNFGPARTSRSLLIETGGDTVQRGTVSLDAGQQIEKEYRVRFRQVGEQDIKISLEQSDTDGAQWDDTIRLPAYVGTAARVLLINGDPRAIAADDELFFVERALRVRPQNQSAFEVDIVDAERFGLKNLENYDVVIIANAMLSVADVSSLVGYVDRGGGVLLSLGPRFDIRDWNERYSALLPRQLRSWHLAKDERAGTDAVAAEVAADGVGVFADLAQPFEMALARSKTSGHFNVQTSSVGGGEVLLKYKTGEPLLLERVKGEGVVMLWTTSLDRDRSDICLQPIYPALLRRMVNRMSGQEAHLVRLGIFDEGLATRVPMLGLNGRRVQIMAQGKVHKIINGADLLPIPTQFQQLWINADNDGIWRPAARILVNSSRQESDFSPISPSRLTGEQERLSGIFGGAAPTRLWSAWLLLLMLGWLSLEALLAMRP